MNHAGAGIDRRTLVDFVSGLGRHPSGELVELLPSGSIRSYRLGDVAIRIDIDEVGKNLGAEAQALRTLESATERAIAPRLLASEIARFGGRPRPALVYEWVNGEILSLEAARRRAGDVGELFATLHCAPVFDLVTRFGPQGPRTLLQEFKRAVDDLKHWLLAREADGLGPDLLTLTLSDLQRDLREFVLAQDQHFLVGSRRTLCHGISSPRTIVGGGDGSGPLLFCNFDRAHIGDPARDLARYALLADLDDNEEDELLSRYTETLKRHRCEDPGFISRYFARRVVALFVAPAKRLRRILSLKEDEEVVVDDRIAAIESEIGHAQRDLLRAFNGLNELTQRKRPMALREVAAMGKLVAYEELLLEGRAYSIALHGDAYAGKTEVGSTTARRLRYRYLNTGAIGRALTWVERERIAAQESVAPGFLVRALFARGFALEPTEEAPYYRVYLDGDDVTEQLQHEVDRVRGATLLDDESVRACLRDAIAETHVGEGVVCEGAYAHTLLPGRVRDFHLRCSSEVRRQRLMQHRPDIENPQEADRLLEQLDRSSVPSPPTAQMVDMDDRPAGAGALAIIRALIPDALLPEDDDLSGRPPLFID